MNISELDTPVPVVDTISHVEIFVVSKNIAMHINSSFGLISKHINYRFSPMNNAKPGL
jgi:hypothetical protein